MNILIIGAGGREHALAWSFAKDARVNRIFVAPGNAGTATTRKCQNVALNDIETLQQFACEQDIDITVVGPETLLADGIVDAFKAAGLAIFGPHRAAARLESSKAFAKQFMLRHGVKTADYREFSDIDAALAHLDGVDYPVVIKADGLAAGKGVIIAETRQQARAAIVNIMEKRVFGMAGAKVVIENFLTGVEASVLSFVDNQTIVPLLSAKDHKKIGEGETGLNTGGMGVLCPNPFMTKALQQAFVNDVLTPTLSGLQAQGLGFSGMIFFGLMLNDNGIYLIEYNMRWGDPETQTLLPLLNTSLVDLTQASINNHLSQQPIVWKDQHACCVVAAAKGYPESYAKGDVITGTEHIDAQSQCFMAGVTKTDGQLTTAGGRVLNIVSVDNSREAAIARAYRNLKNIDFNGITYRRDIGKI